MNRKYTLMLTAAVALAGAVVPAGRMVELDEDLAKNLLRRDKARPPTDDELRADGCEVPADDETDADGEQASPDDSRTATEPAVPKRKRGK